MASATDNPVPFNYSSYPDYNYGVKLYRGTDLFAKRVGTESHEA